MASENVERLLRLAEHDVAVLQLLTRAATKPTLRDVSDWKTTLLFYAACVLVKAVGEARGIELEDHFTTKQWLNTTKDVVGVAKSYRNLEESSRQARYEGRRLSDSGLHQALLWFVTVRERMFTVLRACGYTTLPPLDASSALRG